MQTRKLELTYEECLSQLEEGYFVPFYQEQMRLISKYMETEGKLSPAMLLRFSRYLNAMKVAIFEAKLLAAIDTARLMGDDSPMLREALFFARNRTTDYDTYVEARDDVLRSLSGAARKPYPRKSSGGGPSGPRGPRSRSRDNARDYDDAPDYDDDPDYDDRPDPENDYLLRAMRPKPQFNNPPAPQPSASSMLPEMQQTYNQLTDDEYAELFETFPPECQQDLREFTEQSRQWAGGKLKDPPEYPDRCLKFLEKNAAGNRLLQHELNEVKADKMLREMLAKVKGPGGGPNPIV
jgi:hypothetical protein